MVLRIGHKPVPSAVLVLAVATALSFYLVSGCGIGRSQNGEAIDQPIKTPPGAPIEGAAGDVSNDTADRQAEELGRIDGVVTDRIGNDIRITCDCAVLFEFDSAMLTTASRKSLEEMADVFTRYPDTEIAITAYTDTDGPEDYRRKLSARRAMSVRDYLVDLGVPPSRLSAITHDELESLSPNTGDSDRRPSHRVEIIIRATER